METLPSLGTAISDIVQPTFKTYTPILLSNASAIKSTPCKTFTYGDHPRQQLDVYYPNSLPANSSSPILVFFYGGGLVRGSKTLPMIPNNLVHANVGHFFTKHYGYTVVIADYRLMSHGAKFPSGGEDVALVIDWIVDHLDDSPTSSSPPTSEKQNIPRDLFMMGNSAGGIHLSTFLFADLFHSTKSKIISSSSSSSSSNNNTNQKLKLKAIIELSVPFHFRHSSPAREETLTEYYGTKSEIEQNSPLGLLTLLKQKQSITKTFPDVKFLVLNGTLDPEDEILIPKKEFVDAWKGGDDDVDKAVLKVEMMEGMNHISPPLSLGTGKTEEEKWGHQVGRFCDDTR